MFNYAPDEVKVLVAGIIPITGFVDGTFVGVSKDVLPFTAVRTSDGKVSRVYNRDQTYTLTLSLSNASASNDLLTKLWQLDELTQRGKFPVLIRDLSGTDLFFSATTWIEQIPNMDKDSDITSRTWTLRSSQAVINVGGNESVSSILGDIVNAATSALPSLEGRFR